MDTATQNGDLVRERLWALIREHGTQKAVAEKLGISRTYLSDVLNKRRSSSEKLLELLGLRSVIVPR